mgnify:CR=1 FL=1
MKKKLYLLEIAAFIFTAAIGILWYQNPSGNYEPLLVISGAAVAIIIEAIRRNQKKEEDPISFSTSPVAIQRRILDNSATMEVSLLLSETLRLAKLQKDIDLEKWTKLEINGYFAQYGMIETDVVPEYRAIQGQHTDEYGRPLLISDPKLDFINETRLRFGAKELEELSKKSNEVFVRDPTAIEVIKNHLDVNVTRFVFSPISVSGVINRIRTELIERIEALSIST